MVKFAKWNQCCGRTRFRKIWFEGEFLTDTTYCNSLGSNICEIETVEYWRVAGKRPRFIQWASYQICRIPDCACAGNTGNVTHVPWCMSGSLACVGGENVLGIPGIACATHVSGKKPICDVAWYATWSAILCDPPHLCIFLTWRLKSNGFDVSSLCRQNAWQESIAYSVGSIWWFWYWDQNIALFI